MSDFFYTIRPIARTVVTSTLTWTSPTTSEVRWSVLDAETGEVAGRFTYLVDANRFADACRDLHAGWALLATAGTVQL